MSGWLDQLRRLAGSRCASVLVTVAASRGSVPRGAGTKMVVTADHLLGTIGGGHLELKATEIARELLARGDDGPACVRRFPLGPSLGQCCGGTATMLFEPIPAALPAWVEVLEQARANREPAVLVTRADAPPGSDKLVVGAAGHRGGLGEPRLDALAGAAAAEMLELGEVTTRRLEGHEGFILLEPVRPPALQVVVFGAGHVGRALVRVLAALPCAITWVDGRAEQFPETTPAAVTVIEHSQPQRLVAEMPPDSFYLVMTHSHALDLEICERVLAREDRRYCGLIGSRTKRRRFEKRLAAGGIDREAIASLTCPIGIDGIADKHPGTIAVAAAAQILRLHEAATSGAAASQDASSAARPRQFEGASR